MATATASYHSLPRSLWISIEIRFMQPDYQLQWNLREGKGARTVPWVLETQHIATCIWGINSSKMEQSAKLTRSLCEEQVGTLHWACSLRAVFLSCMALWKGCKGDLGVWVDGTWKRHEKSLMRSTIKVQKKIRTELFCFGRILNDKGIGAGWSYLHPCSKKSNLKYIPPTVTESEYSQVRSW